MGGRQKQAPTPGPASSSIPVPEDAVRQLIEAQRAEAELSVIAAQLRGIPELKREPDAPISDYVDGLLKRRAELLKGHKATAMLKREVRPRPLDSLVLSVAAHFGPWTTVWMPYFGPGWERTPRTAGTSGRISREDFDPKESFGFPGSIRYSFLATDSGEVDPHKPKYWVTASAASINLPEAPFDGELYFRFRVCGLTDFWRVDDYSGYYSQFVWIGGTPDIVTDNPFLVTAEVVGLNPFERKDACPGVPVRGVTRRGERHGAGIGRLLHGA